MHSSAFILKVKHILVLRCADNLLSMGKRENMNKQKLNLAARLPANDMREATGYLRMKNVQISQSITPCQRKYVNILVSEMGLSERSPSKSPCDPAVECNTIGEEIGNDSFPYRNLIGRLLYIGTFARLDRAVATSMLASNVDNASVKRRKAARKVLRF